MNGCVSFYMCARFERFERKGRTNGVCRRNGCQQRSVSNDFPIVYRQVRSLIENAVLYIEGKVEVSRYNGEIQLIADKIDLAENVQIKLRHKLVT